MRIPVLAAVVLFVLSFLIDVYIYSDVRTATRKRGARLAYIVSTLLCWSLLVVIMCMPKRSEESDLLPVMWMLYTYLSIYMGKIGYVLCSLAGRLGWCGGRRSAFPFDVVGSDLHPQSYRGGSY